MRVDQVIGMENKQDLKIITLGVECQNPGCNHNWGIRVADYKTVEDIPDEKFVCVKCFTRHVRLLNQ